MSKILWKSLLVSPAILGTVLAVSSGAIAAETGVNAEAAQTQVTAAAQDLAPVAVSAQPEAPEADVAPVFATIPSQAQTPVQIAQQVPADTSSLDQVNRYSTEGKSQNSISQVTSVSQLSDVQPTDWAFQALQSLVERYGCIAGYPDGTYRGNRAMTRYEFAAGLNACMDRVNELIAAGTADLVTKEDLATLQRLQEEFSAELATLRGRVDALEARTAELEANQFSTTTKLNGEAIFAVTNAFGDEGAGGTELDDETAVSDRVRLNLDSSFTGSDRLRIRLQASNVPEYGTDRTGTNMTRLGFDGEEENDVELTKLFYRFPLGDNTNVVLDATGAEFYENIDVINPLFASSGSGSISRFGRFNPIYRQGAGGAGLTVNTGFGKAVSVSLGYLADNAQDPSEKAGLFDGPNAALAQVAFRPFDALSLGFTYVRAYDPGFGVEADENGELTPLVNVTSSTGSRLARRPFGNGIATATDNFGVEANFRLGSKISLGGWVGYTEARAKSGALEGSDAEIWNWAANVGFTDLGKEGSLLGVIVGMPPKLTDVDGGGADDDDTSLHLEALYRYPVNDNIDVTPGLLVIFNPEHNDANDTIYVGTLRTTFKF